MDAAIYDLQAPPLPLYKNIDKMKILPVGCFAAPIRQHLLFTFSSGIRFRVPLTAPACRVDSPTPRFRRTEPPV